MTLQLQAKRALRLIRNFLYPLEIHALTFVQANLAAPTIPA